MSKEGVHRRILIVDSRCLIEIIARHCLRRLMHVLCRPDQHLLFLFFLHVLVKAGKSGVAVRRWRN